jgi:hypothetical protein
VKTAWLSLLPNLTAGIITSPLRLATGTTPYSSSQMLRAGAVHEGSRRQGVLQLHPQLHRADCEILLQ